MHRAMTGLIATPAFGRIAGRQNPDSRRLRVVVVLFVIFYTVSDYSCFVRFQQRY
jgi:hypothetical protein